MAFSQNAWKVALIFLVTFNLLDLIFAVWRIFESLKLVQEIYFEHLS